MILACQKLLGKLTSRNGNWVEPPPPPCLGIVPTFSCFSYMRASLSRLLSPVFCLDLLISKAMSIMFLKVYNYSGFLALAPVSWGFWPFIHLFLCHMRGGLPARLTRKISRQGRNMSRLARNCPILTGEKIWNWQKLAAECRKCGRPIWCFVVVCNLNEYFEVFCSHGTSFPFLHLHVSS